MMRNWRNAEALTDTIRAFERLQEKAKANNFSAQLMSTTMIATVLAAFCAILLAQERGIEIVGWFPDRDNITTSHERIAEFMYGINFSAFCQRHGIDERPIKLLIGRPEPDAANPRQGWYDELVRISDFVAGPLAGWHYRRNFDGRQTEIRGDPARCRGGQPLRDHSAFAGYGRGDRGEPSALFQESHFRGRSRSGSIEASIRFRRREAVEKVRDARPTGGGRGSSRRG
jgi:hypothetical protein